MLEDKLGRLNEIEVDFVRKNDNTKGHEYDQNWYENVRKAGWELASQIIMSAPDNEERKTAIMKVREAVFWANASISRGDNK